MLAMPARSDRNATRRPSGDHEAFDGWRMSISCSIVRRCTSRDAAGCGGCAPEAMSVATAVTHAAEKDFITTAVYPPAVLSMESHRTRQMKSNFPEPPQRRQLFVGKSPALPVRFDRVPGDDEGSAAVSSARGLKTTSDPSVQEGTEHETDLQWLRRAGGAPRRDSRERAGSDGQ